MLPRPSASIYWRACRTRTEAEVAASIRRVKQLGATPILAYYSPIPGTALWPRACAVLPLRPGGRTPVPQQLAVPLPAPILLGRIHPPETPGSRGRVVVGWRRGEPGVRPDVGANLVFARPAKLRLRGITRPWEPPAPGGRRPRGSWRQAKAAATRYLAPESGGVVEPGRWRPAMSPPWEQEAGRVRPGRWPPFARPAGRPKTWGPFAAGPTPGVGRRPWRTGVGKIWPGMGPRS